MSQHFPYSQHPNGRRIHDVQYVMSRSNSQTSNGHPGQDQVSMGPPPRPIPLDPELGTIMANPLTPSPTDLFSLNSLGSDPSKDYRGSNHSWTPTLPIINSSCYPADPISRFYAEPEPWSSQRVTGVSIPLTSAGQNKRQRLQESYGNPQYSTTKPDYNAYGHAYPHSDSGYGTKSVTTTSVISANTGDHGQGYPDQPGGGDSVHQYPSPMDHAYKSDPQATQGSYPHASNVQVPDSTSTLKCKRCVFVAKCASEMKKHSARHTKPHKCDATNCSRKEGFSTINDLERHKKCVHKIAPQHGFGKVYKCYAEGCSRKEKMWPRLDNFRQHLSRMHSSEDADALVKKSEQRYDIAMRRARMSQFVPLGRARQIIVNQQSTPQRDESQLQAESQQIGNLSSQGEVELHHKQASVQPPNGTRSSARASLESLGPNPLPGQTRDSVSSPGQMTHMHKQQTVIGVGQEFNTTLFSDQKHHHQQQRRALNLQNMSGRGVLRQTRSLPGETPRVQPIDFAMSESDATPDQLSGWSGHDLSGFISDFSLGASSHDQTTLDLERDGMTLIGTLDGSLQVSNPYTDNMQEYVRLRTMLDLSSASPVVPTAQDASVYAIRADDSLDRPDCHQEIDGNGAARIGGLSTKNDALHSGVRTSTGEIKCIYPKAGNVENVCGQLYKRPCDFRKHMYRHEKPWGCTFPGCKGRSGRKSDWRRHERRRHHQQELYRCDELVKSDSSESQCAQAFNMRGLFREHLLDNHKINNEEQLSMKVKACHIRRNWVGNFWCGFCHAIIQLKKEKEAGWNERADHIDRHFMAGMAIGNWLLPEGHKLKSQEDGFLSGAYGGNEFDEIESYESHEDDDAVAQTSQEDSASKGDNSRSAPVAKAGHGGFFFHCCRCKQGPYNFAYQPACVEVSCLHQACESCPIDRTAEGNDRSTPLMGV